MPVFDHKPLSYFAINFSTVPIICSLVATYRMFWGSLRIGKFRNLMLVLHLINITWQTMGIFADFTIYSIFKVFRMLFGVHLMAMVNYSELEILKSFGIITGFSEAKVKYMQIGTFVYCYFLSWAAVLDSLGIAPDNDIIQQWSQYGLVIIPMTYILYDNIQIFYLLYLIFKECKQKTTNQSIRKRREKYDKIRIYFFLVVIFDWCSLILWGIGYLSDTNEWSRIGESLAGLHVSLLTLSFEQIKTFTFMDRKPTAKPGDAVPEVPITRTKELSNSNVIPTLHLQR